MERSGEGWKERRGEDRKEGGKEGGKGEIQERRKDGEEGVEREEREEREGEGERGVRQRLRESLVPLPHHILSHTLNIFVCSQFHGDHV